MSGTYDHVTNTVTIFVDGWPGPTIRNTTSIRYEDFENVGHDRAKDMEADIVAESIATFLNDVAKALHLTVEVDR